MKLRSRLLRPGFFSNDQLLGCSLAARLVYTGLWCLADCEGLLEDRPSQVKRLVLPAERANMDKLLGELAAAKLIVRYEVSENRLIWIPKFKAHQTPHPHEAKSALPPPPADVMKCHGEFTKTAADSDVITCNGISRNVYEDKNSIVPTGLDLWFEESFRPQYPEHRQVQEATAKAALRKINPDAVQRAGILERLELWKQCEQWRREGGAYVPGMGKFFKDGLWKRDPPKLSGTHLNAGMENLKRIYEREAQNGAQRGDQDSGESQGELVPATHGRHHGG